MYDNDVPMVQFMAQKNPLSRLGKDQVWDYLVVLPQKRLEIGLMNHQEYALQKCKMPTFFSGSCSIPLPWHPALTRFTL